MRTVTLLLSALLLATTAPRLEAQVLDGQWFKMTVSFGGAGVNSATGEAEAGQIKKVVNYVQLNLAPLDAESAPTYDVKVVSITTDGTWIVSGFSGTVQMLDPQESFVRAAMIGMPTKPLDVVDGSPNVAQVTFNGPVKTKLKADALTSAKITSLGATSYFTNDTFPLYGKAKLTLTRVGAAKLPFELALLASPPTPPAVEAKPAASATKDAVAQETGAG
jgi:hypothetical protein